jgi:hypothetical protein
MIRLAQLVATMLVLWAATTPVRAGDAPPTGDDTEEIVITAKQREALRSFVESLAQSGRTGQLARWDGWICPTVLGIESAQAAWLEGRIAEVASSVKLRRASDSCRPSLFVIITSDAAGLAKELQKTRPKTLRTDGRWKLERFDESEQPVRWLSVTDACPHGCGLTGSRLTMSTTPMFSALLVIVDAAKVTGFSLAEVADYVALVALANPAPDTEAPVDSILSMFDRPHPPETQYVLTDSDRAFLTGLYESGANQSGQFQRNAIARTMAKTPPAGAEPHPEERRENE